MKYLSLLILLMVSVISVQAQSITVTPYQHHLNGNQNTFPLDISHLLIGPNSIQVGGTSVDRPGSWAVSHQGKIVSFLMNRGELYLLNLDSSGIKIAEKTLEFFDPADQTLKVYSFDDGRTVVRDNVANFTFFDAAGSILYSYSNSSQSSDGERESQLSADSNGRTVVLYNPMIAYGNRTGSRASIVYGEGNSIEIFRESERVISQLNVSDDGSYLTLLATNSEGSFVQLYDRFGNELYQYQTGDNLEGVSLSSDANYITKYSSGRVQVFNVQTGESMGNASSRSTIFYAVFIPQDETVLAMGGSFTGRSIMNPTITAVHLGLRQITSSDISAQLSTLDQNSIRLIRAGVGKYRVTGLNKDLILETKF